LEISMLKTSRRHNASMSLAARRRAGAARQQFPDSFEFFVFRSEHAHRGEERIRRSRRGRASQRSTDLPAMFSTRNLERGCQISARGTVRPPPDHRVDFIVLAWNFAMARWRPFPDGALGSRRQEKSRARTACAVPPRVFLFHHMFGRGAVSELDQRGMRLTPSSARRVRLLYPRSAARPDGLVVHQHQEVDFLERARRPPSRSARLRSMRRMSAAPTSGAESRWRRTLACLRRVKRPDQPAGWLHRESRRIFQHVLSYSKVALSLFLRGGPTDAPSGADAVEIHVYESLFVHHLSFVRSFCAPLESWGRFSSSSCRPTGSFFARRDRPASASPAQKDRGVYPIATPDRPFQP